MAKQSPLISNSNLHHVPLPRSSLPQGALYWKGCAGFDPLSLLEWTGGAFAEACGHLEAGLLLGAMPLNVSAPGFGHGGTLRN